MRSWVLAGLGVTLVALGGRAVVTTLASPDPPGDVVGPALVVSVDDGGWRQTPGTASGSRTAGASSPPASGAGKNAGSARQGRVAASASSSGDELDDGHPATVKVPLSTLGAGRVSATSPTPLRTPYADGDPDGTTTGTGQSRPSPTTDGDTATATKRPGTDDG